jgi:decaprenyl-phosphate phosphoribosyltransferase
MGKLQSLLTFYTCCSQKPDLGSPPMPVAGERESLREREPIATPAFAGPTEARSGTEERATPHRGLVRALIATMRPRQWIKNVLVIAAASAAGALGHDDVPLRLTLSFAAFCLLASGIYAINDVRDAVEDRVHPRKRFRPVAAGELDPRVATAFGIVLIAGGLAGCVAIRPLLGLVGAGYVALTLSYTLIWRHIILLDVIAIAGGFVLRAVAGGVAAPVTLSRWFVLVVTSAAVFVAAAKRLAELQRPGGAAQDTRSVLNGYTPPALLVMLGGSVAVASFAYCVWAFQSPHLGGIPWRALTVAPFAACLARYLSHVWRGDGEAPEDIVLGDRWLLAAAFVWAALFGLSVHAAA